MKSKRLSRLAAGLVGLLSIVGCGSTHGEADGYLTDHNICRKSEPIDLDGQSGTVPSGFQELYGTMGSGPRAGQEFTNMEKRELWGLQLYLMAPAKPVQGLTVSINTPDGDGNPGDDVASATLSPGMIPAEGGWVDVQLKALLVLEPIKTYWLTITPHYGSSDGARVSWAHSPGRGFATFSVQSNRWLRDDTKTGLFRFLECQ